MSKARGSNRREAGKKERSDTSLLRRRSITTAASTISSGSGTEDERLRNLRSEKRPSKGSVEVGRVSSSVSQDPQSLDYCKASDSDHLDFRAQESFGTGFQAKLGNKILQELLRLRLIA